MYDLHIKFFHISHFGHLNKIVCGYKNECYFKKQLIQTYYEGNDDNSKENVSIFMENPFACVYNLCKVTVN